MHKLSDFITPSYAADVENNIDYSKLDMDKVREKPSIELLDKFKKARKSNKKINDLWNNTIDMKPSRSERDFTLAKELKGEGFTLFDAAIILFNYKHGKNKDLTRREIVRCYERSGNDFTDSVDQAYIDKINKQVNPILAARAAGTPLDIDLDRSQRFRSVLLHEMDWKNTGRPIYRDFIYENSLTIIYGRSNTGKSFFATDLAGHIALSRDWAGMEYESADDTSVLYICAEAGQSFGVRGQALLKRLGVDKLPFHVITDAPNFTDDKLEDASAIVERIKAIEKEHNTKIGLVVIDTLAMTFKGNENNSEEMGHYIKSMKHIQNKARTGVAVVHHAGKDQTAGARGSSALQAATDTEMEVKSENRGDKEKRQIEVRKQREGKNGMIIPFGLYVTNVGDDDRGKPIDTCYVVLENDTEFDSVMPDETEDLNDSAKAALQALKFYDLIPNPDIDRFTPLQIKTLIHHDLVKKNSIFDIKSLDNAMSEVAAMRKPDSSQMKAFSRACDMLLDRGLTEKNDKYQLVTERLDRVDND